MEVSEHKTDEDADRMPQLLCAPCKVDDKHVAAEGYCETCRHHLCEQCYKYHNIPVPTKHHVLVDKSRMPLSLSGIKSVEVVICTDICPSHEGEYIKYVCNRHDQLACSACVTLDHAHCSGKIAFIPEVAKIAEDNEDYKDMKKLIKCMQTAIEMMKTRFEQNMKTIQQQDNDIARTILQLKEDRTGLISVHSVVDDTQDIFQSVWNDNLTLMEKQVDRCQCVSAAIENLIRNMERKEQQRVALFVAIVTGKSQVISFQKQIAALEHNEVILCCKFVPDTETEGDKINNDILTRLMPDMTALQSQLKDTVEKVRTREDIIKQQNTDMERLNVTHEEEKAKHIEDKQLLENKHIEDIQLLEKSIQQYKHDLQEEKAKHIETREQGEIEMRTRDNIIEEQKAVMDRLTTMNTKAVAKHKEDINNLNDALKKCKHDLDEARKTAQAEVSVRDDTIEQQNAEIERLKSTHHEVATEKENQIDALEDSLRVYRNDILRKAETEVNMRDTIQKLTGELCDLKSTYQEKQLVIREQMQTIETLQPFRRWFDDTGNILVECVSCKQNVIDHKTLQCGHLFCWKCLEKLSQARLPCPACGMITESEVTNDLRDSTLVKAEEHHAIAYDDAHTSYTGIAVCNDGRFILCNYNGSLYLYNPSNRTKLKLKLEHGKLFCAIQIDDTHLAVSSGRRKTISIVSVGKKKLREEKIFRTQNEPCTIVALNNEQLAVAWSRPPAFGVIDISGTELVQISYIDQDTNGRKFNSFEYLTVDESREHVIQPCFKDKAIYCFDFTGNPVFKYTDPGLTDPQGVALDKCGNIYVCEYRNDSIHKLSPTGEPISVITEGVPPRPVAICSDVTGTGFWVIGHLSADIVHFRLEQNI